MALKFHAYPMELALNSHQVYGTMVENYPLKWINPGEPPELTGLGDAARLITSSNSISTPGWDVPKNLYVSVPRFTKLRSPVPPVQPLFLPPRRPKYPIRRKKSSEKAWNRILRKYGARVAVYEIKLKSYVARYHVRQELYTRRLAAFKRRNEKVSFLASLRKKKLVGKKGFTTNNPFEKVRISDTGWNVLYYYRIYYVPYVNDDIHYTFLVPGAGNLIYFERAIYGTCDVVPPTWGYDHPWPVLPDVTPPIELIATARWKSVNKLYERIGDQSAHIGNMLAERAQTYNMLAESVARLQKFLQSPKRAVTEYITKSGVTKRVGNDFIQYCFGVEPLVKDVYALAQDLNKITAHGHSVLVKVRSGGSASDSKTWEVDNTFYTDTFTVSWDVRCRNMAQYRLDSAALTSLTRFGLLNPAEVLWEVTPWSFVIDWFLPVGKFIASLTADFGLTYETGTSSTHVVTTQKTVRKYKTDPFLLETQGKDWSGSINRTKVTESHIRKVEITAPPTRLPRFKSPFSTRHFLLSLALWRQRQ